MCVYISTQPATAPLHVGSSWPEQKMGSFGSFLYIKDFPRRIIIFGCPPSIRTRLVRLNAFVKGECAHLPQGRESRDDGASLFASRCPWSRGLRRQPKFRSNSLSGSLCGVAASRNRPMLPYPPREAAHRPRSNGALFDQAYSRCLPPTWRQSRRRLRRRRPRGTLRIQLTAGDPDAAVRISAACDLIISQTALFARAPARTEPSKGRRTQAKANARTATTCVTRTFQSGSPPKSPSSDCISRTTKNCTLKQTIISVTGHLECSSFDLMSAELGAVAAAAPVPLLTAQARVVENEEESSNN